MNAAWNSQQWGEGPSERERVQLKPIVQHGVCARARERVYEPADASATVRCFLSVENSF